MSRATISRIHTEWLSLVEISGPFLTLPVLQRAFPHGLDPVDVDTVADLRGKWYTYKYRTQAG